MVNLILILDTRAKRVADTKIKPISILDIRARRVADTKINRLDE